MSKMLVAYNPCGCRIAALLDASDAVEADIFRDEYNTAIIQEEECERIGAHFCLEHSPTGVWRSLDETEKVLAKPRDSE